MTERYTVKHRDGCYSADNIELAVQRLGRLEDMYVSLCEERDRLAQTLSELADGGNTRTVTYKQYFAKRMTIIATIAKLEIYMQ